MGLGLAAPARRFVGRLHAEFFTRRGRRRFARRLASRGLVLLPVLVWSYLFTNAFWVDEVTRYVRGRVIVEGPRAPVLGLAVVLVPAPADRGRGYGDYLRVDPGAFPAQDPDSAVVWLWPDAEGWFDAMHVAAGVRYRVEVRRPADAACPVHVAGHRVFRLLDFFSRRLEVVVPPCPA